ncbi:UNVERIFIED_CONTAM: ammonium transporter [Siphonaria sp. JEL0065]|nr:ammonium transporter [Siphonaria sp. JEL0065]
MHSPRFFLGLLALASSMIPAAQAGPVQKTKATLPGFYQPPATRIEVPAAESSFAAASFLSNDEALVAATDFLSTGAGVDNKSIEVTHRIYSADSNLHHIYYTETFHGLPIANAVSNVNIDATGSVLSIHQSFVPSEIKNSAIPVAKRDAPIISLEQAVLQFAEAKGYKTNDKLAVSQTGDNEYTVSGASFALQEIRASQKYYQTATGLVHVWDLSVEQADVWQNVFVNTENGEIVGVANWTADSNEESASNASKAKLIPQPGSVVKPTVQRRAGQILDAIYNVIPIGARNPKSNNGLTQVKNPWDINGGSPQGWHNSNKDLSGNNVLAQSNPNNVLDINKIANLPRPLNADQIFNYNFDASKGSESQENRDAATTSMFYVTNAVHDIFYNYGFTEAAGSFQIDNFGKGGKGNDPVIATSQDGAGKNNANFATPPDGYPGKMRMYTFTTATPDRDGALENDIVIHELGHGLSNRLTGGPANSNCLATTMAGGLGEGWSDVVGYILSMPATFTRANDYAMGYWAVNRAGGVRKYPYSTSLVTNKHMYSALKTLNEVHNIGEVWAQALYEVLWNLVDATGGLTAPAEILNAAESGTGNTILLKLLIAAMKIQPCNPDFLQARNAIIRADQSIYNGKFSCAIWAGFAKRGVGFNADGTFNDNFELPVECASSTTTSTTTTNFSTTTTTTTNAKTTSTTTTTTLQPSTTTTTTAGPSSIETGTTASLTISTTASVTTSTYSTAVPTSSVSVSTALTSSVASSTSASSITSIAASSVSNTIPIRTPSTYTTSTISAAPTTSTVSEISSTSVSTSSTTSLPTPCAQAWSATGIYKNGDIVSLNNINYKRQSLTSGPGSTDVEIAWVSLGSCVPGSSSTTTSLVQSTETSVTSTQSTQAPDTTSSVAQTTTQVPSTTVLPETTIAIPTTSTSTTTTFAQTSTNAPITTELPVTTINIPSTTSTTTTTSVVVIPQNTEVPSGASAGSSCSKYGAWECSYSLICSYGSGGLVWVQVGSQKSCGNPVVVKSTTAAPIKSVTAVKTTTTTTVKSSGNPIGQPCVNYASSQCVNGATYYCGGGFPYSWQFWYNSC